MKVAIIGAGGAGLCAGRHCLEENFDFDIFEQTGNVGGTWNYTDCVGLDENGLPVHSSMYKNLSTNLPKELMEYEDFPYPEMEQSYLPQEDVLDYIQSYARKFQIIPHIKFFKYVSRIERKSSDWLLEFQDVKTKEKEIRKYDAIIVCNGHYSDPFLPEIPGSENFPGRLMHSHNYRSPESYQNKKVLVIGAGPSGTQIAQQISAVAEKVFLSHNLGTTFMVLPEEIIQKPIVRKIQGSEVHFQDDSVEKIDDILFCTGYLFTFPFLTESCGIKIQNNYVHPLYKQMISVENPTLAFIGLTFTVCPFPLFGIQIRFFMSTLNGHFELPSKEEMLRDLGKELAEKIGRPMRKYHQLGADQGKYFEDLAETAKIKRVPPVISDLYLHVRMNRDLNRCYRIVDDEHWEQIQ